MFSKIIQSYAKGNLIVQICIGIVRAQSLSRVLKELKISELIDTKKGRIEILNKDMIMKELW